MSTLDRIAEWGDWLRIDKQPATVTGYLWELRKMETFFRDKPVMDLTTADLARYIAHRRVMQQCSDATVRRTVNALKSFYRYALGKKSPAGKLPVPTAKKRKQRTLNWEQFSLLIQSCDTSRAVGRRDLALICLATDTGLREAEICRLTLADVDMEHCCLTVTIKGGDDGDGVFGLDTRAFVATWIATRALYVQPGVDTLFVSVGGERPGTPITPSGLRVIFRRLAKQAGFERLSPHDLRRSFATLSSKIGAPSRLIQAAGRWSDIRMVETYTRAIEASDFAPYSPVTHSLKLKHGG